jgi:hypothetical protein
VAYSKGTHRYFCIGAHRTHGAAYCISFGATRADQAVSGEVLRILQPLGVEAALKAIEAHEAQADDGRRQVELALEQARYESNRAQRDQDNPLSAHCRMRAVDRDLIRGGHYGQRSCEPRK